MSKQGRVAGRILPENEDILSAMSEIHGYFDITPEDFAELYRHAYRHARERIHLGTGDQGPFAGSSIAEKARPELFQQEACEVVPGPVSIPGPESGGTGPTGNEHTLPEPILHESRGPLRTYLRKFRSMARSPAGVDPVEIFWSWIGAFVGIGVIGFLHFRFFNPSDGTFLLGSFGASAVLVYGAVKSPLAQPRNLVGGHVISGLIGAACYLYVPLPLALLSALAVATAIACMHWTKTLHPPGGATALIAVIGSEQIHKMGLFYAFFPAGTGALVLLIVGLIVNNLARHRRYPEFWL